MPDCHHVVGIYYILLLLLIAPVGSAIASFKELVTVAQENSTNQTADVLVEDQLQPPLDLVPVSQEQELHNQTAAK